MTNYYMFQTSGGANKGVRLIPQGLQTRVCASNTSGDANKGVRLILQGVQTRVCA